MKEKNYSILANEAADSAMKQQMAIILRFVDKNDITREEHPYLHTYSRATPSRLFIIILSHLITA